MTTDPILTDTEILMIAQKTRALESVEGGYILPAIFARAIEQAVLQSDQVQELRKDAERYRWLRDMIENQDLVIAKVGSWSLESLSGDDPDHYIDREMDKNND